jgi:hypothetical protein
MLNQNFERRGIFMSAKISALRVFMAGATLLALSSCNNKAADRASAQPLPPTRILFIGNSYTSYNGGLDKQLEGLAPAVGTACLAAGGFSLESHWKDGRALEALRGAKWDFVVLQEQSQTPVSNQKSFREFAGHFDEAIRTAGARTVLLMTWERPDSVVYGATTTNLARAINAAGTALGAKVAPAGLAFARSLREKPDLVLYGKDGHPTRHGTYLAACVLYATIFVRSPVGNPFSDTSITPEIRAYLQRIAAEAAGVSTVQ